MQSLHPEELPVGKVSSPDFDFEIPEYQRPYGWAEDESGQLLGDLAGSLERDVDEVLLGHYRSRQSEEGSHWREFFSAEQGRDWTHRVANLLLLTHRKNADAQNYDFDVKKMRYFASTKGTSTFALTSEVLLASKWTPALMATRINARSGPIHLGARSPRRTVSGTWR